MQKLKAIGKFSVTDAEFKILDESGKQVATLIYDGKVVGESELTYTLVPDEHAISSEAESDAKYGQGIARLIMSADQSETELKCFAWDEEHIINEVIINIESAKINKGHT